jgi:hypothetical protein
MQKFGQDKPKKEIMRATIVEPPKRICQAVLEKKCDGLFRGSPCSNGTPHILANNCTFCYGKKPVTLKCFKLEEKLTCIEIVDINKIPEDVFRIE